MEPNVDYELIDAELPSARRTERLLVWCLAALILVLGALRMALQGGPGDAGAMTAAAAMAQSGRNFLVGIADAAGTTTAGPPAGLWPQAALAALLGPSPLSIRLPQVLAAFLACLLAASAVRAGRGSAVGAVLCVALLAFSPAVLALDGDTQGLLWAVVCLLASAALGLSAARRNSAARLTLSALLAGVAFQIVGWAALMVVVALAVLWFAGSETRPRGAAFGFALAVFTVAALAWYGYLAAMEPSVRPQIAGAVGNDPFWLLLEHRTDGAPGAVERLSGSAWGAVNVWWLVWGAVAGVAALLAALTWDSRDGRWPALAQAFWLVWAVAAAAWCAFAPQPQPTHALVLAVALAGLSAHSAMVLLDGMDRPWVALFTAVALFAEGLAQTRWLGAEAVWGRWAFIFPLGACAAALVLAVLRLLPASRPSQWRAVAVAGLVALLVAPAVFALGALFAAPGNPVAQVMVAVAK